VVENDVLWVMSQMGEGHEYRISSVEMLSTELVPSQAVKEVVNRFREDGAKTKGAHILP